MHWKKTKQIKVCKYDQNAIDSAIELTASDWRIKWGKASPEHRKGIATSYRKVATHIATIGRKDLAHTVLFIANEIELGVMLNIKRKV